MNRLAETLLKVSLMLAIASLLSFVVIGTIQVGLSSDGIVRDGTLLAYCGLLFVFAVAIGLCGSVLESWAGHRATKAARIDAVRFNWPPNAGKGGQ